MRLSRIPRPSLEKPWHRLWWAYTTFVALIFAAYVIRAIERAL